MRKVIIIIISLLFFIGIISISNSAAKEDDTKGTVFRALHLLNLNSENDEAEFIAMMNDFNQVISEVGYPNIKYNIWKERGDRQGKYKYFFESTWPDQETYDKVHKHVKYKALVEKHTTRFEELIKEEIYSRYIPLN